MGVPCWVRLFFEMKKKDFKLGALLLLESAGYDKHYHKLGKYLCFCGNEFVASMYRVKTGGTKSCGCYNKYVMSKTMTVHGESETPLYAIWCSMKRRCYNKRDSSYKNYGGRGITVCEEWKNDFIIFRDWCIQNNYKNGLSIDRKNNNKGYSPNNCRWVTTDIQNVNQRTRKDNTSGIPGVGYLSRNTNLNNPWYARISIKGKERYLGYFKTKEEASEVYEKARKERDELYLKEFEQSKLNKNDKH